MTHILQINSSARQTGSVTRDLTDKIVAHLSQTGPTHVTKREADASLPLLNEDWVNANFTPADDRTDAQTHTLALSDQLVAELKAADIVVIGLPVYNFGAPAALKAWIDLVARAGVTFRYTPDGPVGLLDGKRAIIAVASGGVETGSAADYATTQLRQVLGFIGITDVSLVRADQLVVDAAAALAKADADLADLTIAA